MALSVLKSSSKRFRPCPFWLSLAGPGLVGAVGPAFWLSLAGPGLVGAAPGAPFGLPWLGLAGWAWFLPIVVPELSSKGSPGPVQAFPRRPRRLLRLYFLMIFVGEREKCHFVKFAFLSKRNADFSVLGRSMLGPSWSQGGSCCAKFAPSWHQVGPSSPKLAQVGPKLIPSWPQVGPCWFKLVPRWPQVGPKLAQVGPSWPKLGPSWHQVGTKFAHVGPSWPKLAAS